MKTENRFIRKTIVSFYICLTPFLSSGQIPTRFIVNSGFELPVTGCSPASYSLILQTDIPGWMTLDSVSAPKVSCGISSSNAPYLMELWTTGFNSRVSHSGNQFAEINANRPTFLYQEICLLANEVVPFSIWHLRRADSGSGEQMVAELKTTSNISISTAPIDTATGLWSNYTGNLTNNGSSGIRKYGFSAISGGSNGNLIDDVNIYLKPLVDIKDFISSTIYETDTNYLRIYVNGTLNDTATVTISKSGTSTFYSDYNLGVPTRGSISVDSTGDITLTLLPGNYDPNYSSGTTRGLISIPFFILNEGITETNETLTYTITGSANGGGGNSDMDLVTGINGQSAACGITVGSGQFTIIDVIGLPVKLISFTAEREVGFNTIKWEVAEESNIRKYLVEYSTNGTDFSVVDEVLYNPSNFNNYTSTHHSAEKGVVYYRLSEMDNDGYTSVLSNVVELSKNINNTFSIFPNPNNGAFTVNFHSTRETQTEFSIHDVFGKKISTIRVKAQKGDNSVPIVIDRNLAAGIYYITYTSGIFTRTLKMNVLE